MVFLTLELIKKHLNIDEDFHDDDELLIMHGEVAEEVIERHIDRSLNAIMYMNHGEMPKPLVQAALLLVGTYYENRENISYSSGTEIPYTVTYLLSLYQNYGSCGIDDVNLYNQLNKLARVVSGLTDTKLEEGTWIDLEKSGHTQTINVDDIDQGEY